MGGIVTKHDMGSPMFSITRHPASEFVEFGQGEPQALDRIEAFAGSIGRRRLADLD